MKEPRKCAECINYQYDKKYCLTLGVYIGPNSENCGYFKEAK